ncbi:MAG TPA: Hsp20/alpha crystallin family protein [Firmicutes bacterium]|nr:Hsp20/alpha crystallin family protein [Bacillota bacterium]
MSDTKLAPVAIHFADSDDAEAEMVRLLQQFMGTKKPFHGFTERAWRPPTDIYETDCAFIVLIEIAGVEKGAISIEFANNAMRVSGVRRHHPESAHISYLQMEVKYGAYAIELRLPEGLNTDETNARYIDGFLTITIPKRPPQPSRSISIQGEG